MRPAEALGKVEWARQLIMFSSEGALVAPLAAPHPQAYLEGLLKPRESLGERREGDTEAARLTLVMAGPDTQPGAAAREHVQRSDRLGQQTGVPKMYARHDGHQPRPARVSGQERQRRIALQLCDFRPARLGRLPEVVRHADAIEPNALGGARDLSQCGAEAIGSDRPAVVIDVEYELHRIRGAETPGFRHGEEAPLPPFRF